MQCHAETPKRAALDLRQRAVWIHHGAGVHDDRQLLDHHRTAAAIDPDARDASDPSRHVAFLAECGRDAKPGILRHGGAPTSLLCRTLDDRGLALRSADGVRGRAGVTPGSIQHAQAEGDWITPVPRGPPRP